MGLYTLLDYTIVDRAQPCPVKHKLKTHVLLRSNNNKRREVVGVLRSSVVDKIPNPSSSFKTFLFKILYAFIWYFYPVPLVSYIPSNLLISSGVHNFVTPAANLWDQMPGLFEQISKNFKNKLPFKYFSLLMLFKAKKMLIWGFLKFSVLFNFVTKLIFKR
jgi:hypothetical protein